MSNGWVMKAWYQIVPSKKAFNSKKKKKKKKNNIYKFS